MWYEAQQPLWAWPMWVSWLGGMIRRQVCLHEQVKKARKNEVGACGWGGS